ncbi:MAG: transcriptional regulator [Burkholderiales bacterium]|nr:transcriptional regulator [Burkholderiales bacterium]
MDILDSVRRAVRHYPGGVDAVAARLGKSPSTLEKELRAAPQYKLGAVDAAEIAAMCVEHGSDYGLEYPTRIAEAVGATLLVLPRGTDVPDGVTAQALACLVREFADVVTSATLADADGEISRNELLAVERQWAELVAAGQGLMRHLGAKHQATMRKWGAL